MTFFWVSVPSVSVSVTVWVVVLTPSTSVSKVEVTVFAVSRTVSMVCLTVFLPFSSISVIVLMSLRTPSTIWRLVSVMVCFCCFLPLESTSFTVSTVRVTPFSTVVFVSDRDFTTEAVAVLADLLAFLPEVSTAAAALPAESVTEEAAALAAAASSCACRMRSSWRFWRRARSSSVVVLLLRVVVFAVLSPVLSVMPVTAASLAVPTRSAIRPESHEVSLPHMPAMPLMMACTMFSPIWPNSFMLPSQTPTSFAMQARAASARFSMLRMMPSTSVVRRAAPHLRASGRCEIMAAAHLAISPAADVMSWGSAAVMPMIRLSTNSKPLSMMSSAWSPR